MFCEDREPVVPAATPAMGMTQFSLVEVEVLASDPRCRGHVGKRSENVGSQQFGFVGQMQHLSVDVPRFLVFSARLLRRDSWTIWPGSPRPVASNP